MIRDKKLRLGRNGYQEVLKHPFLKNINTKDLLDKKVPAPFVPKLNDLNNFVDSKVKVIDIKDLRESIVTVENKKFVEMNKDNFDAFGQNLDLTSS